LKLKGESIEEWTIKLTKTCKKEEFDILLENYEENKKKKNMKIKIKKKKAMKIRL